MNQGNFVLRRHPLHQTSLQNVSPPPLHYTAHGHLDYHICKHEVGLWPKIKHDLVFAFEVWRNG